MYKTNVDNTLTMPDIAVNTSVKNVGSIDWVGMNNISMPMIYKENDLEHQVQASIGAYVNLVDGNAKGIHMSRLYILLQEIQEITPSYVQTALSSFVQTHQGLSDASRLDLQFTVMLKRPALLSDNSGWRKYPCRISATLTKNNTINCEISVSLLYSSTCPCSKALAAQLVQNKFNKDFTTHNTIDKATMNEWLQNNALYAIPHSQRSEADITVTFDIHKHPFFSIVEIIDIIEQSLGTPVQTAVKREDEQQFALLNGQNPMFCEDAARTIQKALHGRYKQYNYQVNHYESLHPHDAVAIGSVIPQ